MPCLRSAGTAGCESVCCTAADGLCALKTAPRSGPEVHCPLRWCLSQVQGSDAPPPISAFADLPLPRAIAANIARCKYTKPTPVQRYAIPIALAKRDLMACAQTGSGKTAAFVLPIVLGIVTGTGGAGGGRPKAKAGGRMALPRALVMSPARELTIQVRKKENTQQLAAPPPPHSRAVSMRSGGILPLLPPYTSTPCPCPCPRVRVSVRVRPCPSVSVQIHALALKFALGTDLRCVLLYGGAPAFEQARGEHLKHHRKNE